VNDAARLAPTWNVVATMLAPTKIRRGRAVDCVCSAGRRGGCRQRSQAQDICVDDAE
jgi:hypothetical protein